MVALLKSSTTNSGKTIRWKAKPKNVMALNEKWVPNLNDSNQTKWFPWFELGGSSGFRYSDSGGWDSGSVVGSRLCFKTRELAEYSGKQFTEVYKRFMIID